jgi:hypothetical protein
MMRDYKMMARHVLNNPFRVRFSDRSEWRSRFLPRTNDDTTATVYRYGIRKRVSFSLANTSQYFQKCTSLRHVQVRMQIGATKTGTL